jgi:nucleoside-diphosphate-sugar epimerase
MLVGNGMVAKCFSQYLNNDGVVVFASGVSNSKLVIMSEFERERVLLERTMQNIQNRKLVYFSTFNLYDPNESSSPYCLHKLNMEKFIKGEMDNFNIFRLGHVAGQTANQQTILSFLYNAINEETEFNLWRGASRNIIDIEDISKICSYIIDNDLFPNEITNICNSQNTSVLEIVKIFEDITNKKGKYKILEKGGSPNIDNTKIQNIAKNLEIIFDDTYAQRIICKYHKLE